MLQMIVMERMLHPDEDSDAKDNSKLLSAQLHSVVREGDILKLTEILRQVPTKQMMKDVMGHRDKEDFGRSLVLQAACNGNLDIFKLLHQKYDADITVRDSVNNSNAFHLAAANGHSDVIEYLLENAPNLLKKVDRKGNTALHVAATNGHDHIVDQLLACPNINNILETKNDLGRIALHCSCANGHVAIVQKLLKKGIKTDVKDANNDKPSDLAYSRGHVEIVSLLENCNRT